MSLVLDASTVACWAFEDEENAFADLALEHVRQASAFVPGVWWYEIRNVLIMAERRGRTTPANTAAFIGRLSLLDITTDVQPDEATIFRLARTHGLTVYDASYLDLALRTKTGLATLDRRLAGAARAEHVTVLGPS